MIMTAAVDTSDPITEPGVYDLTDDEYHADPVPAGSLSATGARQLLPPNCPALFHYNRTHPQPHNQVFDLGKAAHRLVLGSGPDLAVIDATDWRTKAAKEARAEAYEAGAVPILAEEHQQVLAMADAIREHPIASVLFDPARGRAEQSLFWIDQPSGVWRRARFDWLPDQISMAGRLIIPDYKTTAKADLRSIQKSVHTYGYHQQGAWYQDAALALGLAENAAFVFVFQEKVPPYLVTVVELDVTALMIGRTLNRKAIDVYRHCTATGRWPGYADDIELVALPTYAEIQHNDAAARGDYDLMERP